jgi:hypothetical protein
LGAVNTGIPLISTSLRADDGGVIRMGVDAGADGGGAEVHLADQQRGFTEALLVFAEHHGVGRELLAEGHRHGILQLGAAHFQHIGKFLGLALEGAAQVGHGVDQAEDADVGGELQRGRIDVVGRLAHVDVLVRVQELVLAAWRGRGFPAPGWRSLHWRSCWSRCRRRPG